MEDVIPELKIPPPDQIVETKELRRCVNKALAGLPEKWRRALWLRYGEGSSGRELAKVTGMAESETERTLEHTLQYVRQRLVELGCHFKENESPQPPPAEGTSGQQAAKHS